MRIRICFEARERIIFKRDAHRLRKSRHFRVRTNSRRLSGSSHYSPDPQAPQLKCVIYPAEV